jgi:hypothetical protein
MTKLSQIIAIEKGVKAQTDRTETDLYHELQKSQLFAGLSKSYRPKDEEGDQLPPESTKVQIKSTDVLKQLTAALTRRIDVTATKDAANTSARADVTVDDEVIAAAVPVTTLMSFEKEIEKLAAFIGKIPELDPATDWTYDSNRGVFVSVPVEALRTKKVPKNHVLYPHTEQHPAQVQMFTEDIPVGTWTTTKFSGAMKADDITAIKARLEKLRAAVKFAREEANTIDVVDVHYGAGILNFLFNGNGSHANGEGSPQVSG